MKSEPTGLDIPAWKRGFWRRMPASKVEPERGKPDMKWIPCCIVVPAAVARRAAQKSLSGLPGLS
jgi:hypothetical protein